MSGFTARTSSRSIRGLARAGQEVGDEHVGRADQFVEQRTSLYWYFRKKDDLLNAMTDIAVDG